MAKRLKAQDVAKQERQRMIMRAATLRREIEQVFLDVAHWNDSVRRSDELPIDPDPDGQLRRIADGLDAMLEREANRE